MSLSLILGIGLALGLRHAFEPDHLAAVSTLATRQARLWDAMRLGAAWGIGHTAVVGVVALLVIALGVRLPDALGAAAELLVAVLLVLLGGVVIWRYARGRWHLHAHRHQPPESGPHLHLHAHAGGPDHAHAHPHADARRSLGLGLAHGLAGSGAIAALLLAAAPDGVSRGLYFAAFGVGTVGGMLGVTAVLAAIVRSAARRGAVWAATIHVGAALASMAAGLIVAWRVMWE